MREKVQKSSSLRSLTLTWHSLPSQFSAPYPVAPATVYTAAFRESSNPVLYLRTNLVFGVRSAMLPYPGTQTLLLPSPGSCSRSKSQVTIRMRLPKLNRGLGRVFSGRRAPRQASRTDPFSLSPSPSPRPGHSCGSTEPRTQAHSAAPAPGQSATPAQPHPIPSAARLTAGEV